MLKVELIHAELEDAWDRRLETKHGIQAEYTRWSHTVYEEQASISNALKDIQQKNQEMAQKMFEVIEREKEALRREKEAERARVDGPEASHTP
jgi:uncharacterized protein (DUF3084 family)